MTAIEMNIQFDVLWNNLMSNQAPGLNEYEKSVLLTKAQDEVIKNYLNATSVGNTIKTGFDGSQKRQIDFKSLMCTKECEKVDDVLPVIDSRSIVYKFPDNVLVVINETILTDDSRQLQVIPLTYDEYMRLMCKPFKSPYKHQAWRLINNGNMVELILGANDTIDNYTIRFVKQPTPIVVADLPDGLSINGVSVQTDCVVDESLHENILQRAVEIAKVTWSTNDALLSIGQRSE